MSEKFGPGTTVRFDAGKGENYEGAPFCDVTFTESGDLHIVYWGHRIEVEKSAGNAADVTTLGPIA
jgi:hypothetical protein